jgi:hypothetical protein
MVYISAKLKKAQAVYIISWLYQCKAGLGLRVFAQLQCTAVLLRKSVDIDWSDDNLHSGVTMHA